MANKLVKNKIVTFVLGLKECWPNFEVTANDFLQPTFETNIKFYERFLNECGIQPEAIIREFSMNTDALNEEFMYFYVIYSCARRKYSLLGLSPDYAITLRRFLSPSDDKNLSHRLSLICNNLFYVKLKYQEKIFPLKEKMMDDVDVIERLKNEVDQLNEQLIQVGKIQEKNDNTIIPLEKNKETLSQTLFESQKVSEELNNKIQLLQEELKLCEEENDTLANNFEDNLSKEAKLKAQIVDNPESIVAERCKTEKQIPEFQEQQVRNMELKKETESNILKNYESTCSLTEKFSTANLLNDFDLIDEHINESEKLLKEISISRKTVNEERNIILQLNREYEELEKKYPSLELQYVARAKCLDDEIRQIHNEFSENINQLEKVTVEATSLMESIKYVQNCSRQYKEEIEKQNALHRNMMLKFFATRQSLHNAYVKSLADIKKNCPKNIINTK